MDGETKAAFEAMQEAFRSLQTRFDAVDKRFDAVDGRFQAMEQLVVDMKESLEKEIGDLRTDMNTGFAQVNQRLDIHDTRLARQGGLLLTGSRWTGQMNEWAEKVDSALQVKDLEIAELRERVTRLEKKSA